MPPCSAPTGLGNPSDSSASASSRGLPPTPSGSAHTAEPLPASAWQRPGGRSGAARLLLGRHPGEHRPPPRTIAGRVPGPNRQSSPLHPTNPRPRPDFGSNVFPGRRVGDGTATVQSIIRQAAHRGVRSRSAHARLRSWRSAAGGSRRKLGSKDRVLPCSDVSHEAYSHLVLAENVISRKRAVKCFSFSRERSRSRT